MGKRSKIKVKKATVNKKLAHKKFLATLSIDELLSKAQEEINIFQHKEAQVYCQEALKRDTDNLRALEVSASLCIETGNMDGAKHCLGRAITLAPENGFSKYLSMGQLLEGKDSLQCYLKGISLMNLIIKEENDAKNISEPKLNSKKENGDVHESTKLSETLKSQNKGKDSGGGVSVSDLPNHSIVRKLSNAYCAVAELYMSDLCDEKEAETESLYHVRKAVSVDETNPEAYLHLANYQLIKEELEEAKENIKKSVSLWLPKYKEVDDGEACAGSFDPIEVCPLTFSPRILSARILIEVEEHQLAGDVLETLLGEDDEDIYVWYLIGWNHYLQGDEHSVETKHHFEKALELHQTCPSEDSSIIRHMKELMETLKDTETNGLDEDDNELEENIEKLEEEIDKMDVS